MGWHSLDSNPSLADSNVGALPQCPLLPTGVSGLHPLTQHPSVRDSSPGQGSESWHWTLTLVCQPPSHKASTHVPGLSLGSAAWASCPSIAGRAKVIQAFLKSITTPRVPGPPPRQFRGESGGGCRRKGGVGQEEVGRGSADPQTFLAYATPSLPTSTWASPGSLAHLQTLPRHSSKCHLPECVRSIPSTRRPFPALSSASTAFTASWGGLLGHFSPLTPQALAPWGSPLHPLHLTGLAPCPCSRNVADHCQVKCKLPTQYPKDGASFAFSRGSSGF